MHMISLFHFHIWRDVFWLTRLAYRSNAAASFLVPVTPRIVAGPSLTIRTWLRECRRSVQMATGWRRAARTRRSRWWTSARGRYSSARVPASLSGKAGGCHRGSSSVCAGFLNRPSGTRSVSPIGALIASKFVVPRFLVSTLRRYTRVMPLLAATLAVTQRRRRKCGTRPLRRR